MISSLREITYCYHLCKRINQLQTPSNSPLHHSLGTHLKLVIEISKFQSSGVPVNQWNEQ